MARINVYLPDELAREARSADLNVSALTQDAVRQALAARTTNEWLDEVARRLTPTTGLSHADTLAALDAAREELGR